MFVIELTYKSDLKDIDAHMTAHVKFLKKYYADGTFLVSGRKIPRDGGIILAVRIEREKLDAIVLGGTDLAFVFNEENTDFPHLDGARVHIGTIMDALAEPDW